jgi:hypothetical protein
MYQTYTGAGTSGADEQKERERENQSILYKMDIPEFESSLSRDLGLV